MPRGGTSSMRKKAALDFALVPLFVLALTLGVPANAPRAAGGGDDVPFAQTSEGRTAKRLAKARKEIKKADYKDAIKLLTRVVRDQPDNADA